MDAATGVALGLSGLSTMAAGWALIYGRAQARSAVESVKLNERAQREQAEPYVIADIRPRVPSSSLLVFVIENTGPTLARNVQVQVEPPLRTTLGPDRESVLNRGVTRPIPALPPGRRLTFIMDVAHQLFGSDLPRLYTVTVLADGPFGPVEQLTYVVDLDILRSTALERETLEASAKDIAESSKSTAEAGRRQADALERIAARLNRLHPSEE